MIMVQIERDVPYCTEEDRELFADIYRPENPEKTRTAVLLLHGGGWRFGDRSMMAPFGEELAKHGFVALAPQYRLLDNAPWPAPLDDVRTAVAWARRNANDLGVESARIVLQGFSAGAHLALLAAGRPADAAGSDAVNGVVAFFPPIAFDVGTCPEGVNEASMLLGEGATAEDAAAISPINYANEEFPPTFLLHGNADDIVPPITSQRMYEKLLQAGVPTEMHLYTGHTHEFAKLPSMLPTVVSEIALFLQRTVVDPGFYEDENRKLNMFAKEK